MDLIRFLIALHPKSWRQRYGEEFKALLEDSRLTLRAVVNIVLHAGKLQMRAHLAGLLVVLAVLLSGCCEVVALRAGLTANILWAPTSPVRAAALLGTVGPWMVLLALARGRRCAPRAA